MTLRTKIEIGVVVLLLAVGGIAFRSWLVQHDAMLQAQTTNKAMQTQIDQLRTDDTARFADLEKKLDANSKTFQQAVTPQQIADLATQLMALKQPITITTPAPTPENPNPQPIAEVPLPDAPQAKLYLEACESCKIQLPTYQAQVESLKKQNDLLGQQRDQWRIAAKGTKWGRMKTALKWLAIGSGAGAVALCGSGHCK